MLYLGKKSNESREQASSSRVCVLAGDYLLFAVGLVRLSFFMFDKARQGVVYVTKFSCD